MRRALLVAAVVAGLFALPSTAAGASISVTITSPLPGATVSGVVPITAVTTGIVAVVTFEVSTDAAATWSLVGADRDPADGWSATWDPAGYSGMAVVRATAANDDASATSFVEIAVVNPADPSVAVGRPAFSPNGDGRAERVRISIQLPEPGTLDVRLDDDAGTVVLHLARIVPVRAGTIALTWDGRDEGGGVVADGHYRIVAEITDAIGAVETTGADVTVDTRAPRLRWRRIAPDPFRGIGGVRFVFHIADRSPSLTVSARISDATGGRIVRLAPVQTRAGTAELAWDGNDARGTPAEPGLHEVAVTVRDDAGNRWTGEVRPFRDHRPVTTTVVRRVEGTGPRLALTFDDCTSASAWRRILDILAAERTPASFFCSGPWVAANPSLARRTAEAGSTIGSHGWDHADFTTLAADEARARLRRDADVWWDAAEVTTVPFFRPPYGEYGPRTLRTAGDEGYRYTVLWDVDPRDWSEPGAMEIVHRVLSHAREGSIVLLHVQDETAAALPGILEGLRREGLEPVTLAELIRSGER